jgi:hypothetical protein
MRRKRGKDNEKKEKKIYGTHVLEGDLEALQEWRLRGEFWRGMQNGAPF